MRVHVSQAAIAAALLTALTPATAQTTSNPATGGRVQQRAEGERAKNHDRTDAAKAKTERLRARGADKETIRKLQQQDSGTQAPWRAGGAARASSAHGLTSTSTSTPQQLVSPVCGGAPATTASFAGTTGPILPPLISQAQFTTTVSGVGNYLWTLDLTTAVSHAFNADLVFTLTSPAGTTVTVSSNNGEDQIDVFNGTVWTDVGLNAPATDATYTSFVASTPLNPEGRFAAFRGEDPNGVWTLTFIDVEAPDAGTLNSWSLDVSTLASAPVETTTTQSRTPNLAISTVGTPTVTDVMNASGLGTNLTQLKLYVEIPHTWSSDLDITLTSPSGTTVTVTTDNGDDPFFGIGAIDVFNGTLFDPTVTTPVTDVFYEDFVVATPISPEGSFDNFLGQNPNGAWTLSVHDDTGADGGTLVRWDLTFVTAATAPSPSAPANFAGTTGAIPDFAPPVAQPTVFTSVVSGAGPYLWDLDVTTQIADTFPGDLLVTLTSPAGTTVTLSTVNGDGNDDVFNGTVWDDSVNDPATLHAYANGVLASPLSPEGRLSAFRGEDPNGTWTLTIVDEFTEDNGDVNGWTLDVTTLAAAPTTNLATFSQSPGLVISTAGTPVVSDSMVVSGLPTFLGNVSLYVEIPHTFVGDLTVTLTSPAGTAVVMTAENGVGEDNVLNGTLFTGASTDAVSDHVFTDLVVATVLGPEGSLDNFIGQDPNGSWTLTVADGANQDGGTLVRWDLNLSTCESAGDSFCSNGTLGIDHTAACPCGNTGAAGNGCAHSFDAGGANLSATGSAAADTVVLHSQFEPATSFTLFLQHAAPGDTVFHDGVLCAGGTLIRLRGRAAVAGEAFFPNNAFPNDATLTLSQRGGTFPGSGFTSRYSAWFRNATTTFCPPATANITNGWRITW